MPSVVVEPVVTMLLEIQSASNFLTHLVKLGRVNLSESQLDTFRHSILDVLRQRYKYHWFPEKPHKGSGYRCIRINGKLDPVVEQAAALCGLSAAVLKTTFPPELTIWIDPAEVSYRIGENGSICVLFDTTHKEPWKPTLSQGTAYAYTPAIIKKTPQKKIEEQVSGILFIHLSDSTQSSLFHPIFPFLLS